MTIDEMIADAIDRRDARLAGKVAMSLRMAGWTYNRILRRVQHRRPDVTAAEWDAVLAESDNEEE